MSTIAPKPATTPIPVQLSEPEFEAFILTHLSMPKRGPKCKLGYYRVFNLILWLLGTHLRRDTVILQWFQASKAVAASDGHAVHC